VKLRCKDGDIAVITWDLPDCLENIGRLVQVRGPLKIEDEVAYWRIQPVTPQLYAFRELDDTLARDLVEQDPASRPLDDPDRTRRRAKWHRRSRDAGNACPGLHARGGLAIGGEHRIPMSPQELPPRQLYLVRWLRAVPPSRSC
jgi:hypothetical protein